MIQYSIYNNFSVYSKNFNLETKNIFKNQTPLIKASSEAKKNVHNNQLIYS